MNKKKELRKDIWGEKKEEISGPLIGKTLHGKCYRAMIRGEPLATVRAPSHPRKNRRKSNVTPSSHRSDVMEIIENSFMDLDDQSTSIDSTKQTELKGRRSPIFSRIFSHFFLFFLLFFVFKCVLPCFRLLFSINYFFFIKINK